MFELLSIRKQSVTALFMLTKIFKNLVIWSSNFPRELLLVPKRSSPRQHNPLTLESFQTSRTTSQEQFPRPSSRVHGFYFSATNSLT
jgi:hypothetical protein